MKNDDEYIKILLNSNRTRNIKNQELKEKVRKMTHLDMRIVNVTLMVENKYKKIGSLKGGQKKTFLFKYYPDRDHHKYCMHNQYFVLNPNKSMKEIGYRNNKALLIGKSKIMRNFSFSWNPKKYRTNDMGNAKSKKLNNVARSL